MKVSLRHMVLQALKMTLWQLRLPVQAVLRQKSWTKAKRQRHTSSLACCWGCLLRHSSTDFAWLERAGWSPPLLEILHYSMSKSWNFPLQYFLHSMLSTVNRTLENTYSAVWALWLHPDVTTSQQNMFHRQTREVTWCHAPCPARYTKRLCPLWQDYARPVQGISLGYSSAPS